MNTTANKITIARMILVPLFLVLAYTCSPVYPFIVYLIACLSDMLDGYIARNYNQVSNFGKFMDPLADKILVIAAMCYLVEIKTIPGWVVAVVCFREFAVAGLRMLAAEKNIVIAAAKSGKVKTMVTMVGVALMILTSNSTVAMVVCILIVVTTLYSGVEYFIKNKSVFKEEK